MAAALPDGYEVGEKRCCPSCLAVVVLVQKPEGDRTNLRCPECRNVIPPRKA
jgi:predicted  nucleic acid-binding Zn ribbon protein